MSFDDAEPASVMFADFMTLLRKIYWRVLTAHRSEDGDAACQTPA